MGNKPAKIEEAKIEKEEILARFAPPIDPALARWLARDIQRIEGFTVKNPPLLRPPDHYVEYMRLNGWLDLDLDDPDLAHLFK